MIRGALAGALLFFSGLVAAGGISINPIRIELGAGQRTGSLTVTNDGDATKVLQVTAKQWKQVNGKPVYEPAQDIIATPVLFRVAPRSRQLVRIGFANPPPEIVTELSYRIYLTEVPEDKPGESQIRFLLQIGVPMFVVPARPQDSLGWQLQRLADGKLRLTAENRGNRHVRIQSLRLEDNSGLLVEYQGLDYLLAGGRHEWLLAPKRPPAGGPLRLKARDGRGEIETELPGSTH
jgi:fimbrial chaperone protein